MNIFRKLKQFNRILNDNVNLVRNTEDIYSFGLMKSLLQHFDQLPFTFMSLRPFVIVFAINELLINRRKCILEFGSGVSTIILARAIRMYGLDCRLVSVESDESWLNMTNSILEREGLSSFVDLVYAPLVFKESEGGRIHWYDELTLDYRLRSFAEFDMVLIDGPSAYEKDHELSRYFAMPFLKGRLASGYSIFLDDADRNGEKKVMDMWSREFGLKFTIFGETLGVHYSGKYLDCCPLKFIDRKLNSPV